MKRAGGAGILQIDIQEVICAGFVVASKCGSGFGSSAEWSGRIGAKLLSGYAARARARISLLAVCIGACGR